MGSNKFEIQGKDDLLLQKLLKFYGNPLYLNIFTEIVVQGQHISLRLLDYFSTNYSKHFASDIYRDYKQHLKGYKKQYFDPFCRRERVLVYSALDHPIDLVKQKEKLMKQGKVKLGYKYINDTEIKNSKKKLEVITTVGQLNFFKWCIEKGVIQYILKHYKVIEDNMAVNKNSKRKTNGQIAVV